MHVLILASWYPSTEAPHAGIFVRQQVELLQKRGVNVSVLSVVYGNKLHTHKSEKQPLSHPKKTSAIPLLQSSVSNYFPFIPLSSGFVWIKEGMRLFREYLREFGEPDVLHAHSSLYGGVLGAIIRLRYKTPLIITEHSTALISGELPIWQKLLAKYAFRNADHLIAVSQGQAIKLAVKYGPTIESWDVVYNTVAGIYADKELIIRNKDNFRFLSIGYLIKRKGFDVLLEAFAILQSQKKYHKSVLRIIGEGDQKEALNKLSQKLGIESSIEWIASRLPENIIKDYDHSDVVVSSSRLETFGVTLIEGLARGIPVIATRSGGPEAFVIPQVGKLVEKDDPFDLARSMAEIIDYYQDFIPQDLRNYCLSNFGPKVIIGRLCQIYQIYSTIREESE